MHGRAVEDDRDERAVRTCGNLPWLPDAKIAQSRDRGKRVEDRAMMAATIIVSGSTLALGAPMVLFPTLDLHDPSASTVRASATMWTTRGEVEASRGSR